MKEYEAYLENKGYSSITISKQISHVRSFLKWLSKSQKNILEIDYSELLSYIAYEREKGIKETTLVHYLRYVHLYFDYLLEEKKIVTHPFQYFRLRSKVRHRQHSQIAFHELLTGDELDQIYKVYRQNKRLNIRGVLVLSLAIYQGLSSVEIYPLKRESIDIDNAVLRMPPTSLYEARTIDLEAIQIESFRKYIVNKRGGESLFNYSTPKQATSAREQIKLQVNIELKRRGLRDLRFINFIQIRNSRISDWIARYGLRKAQYLAGHSNIVSTQRYKQTDVEALKQQVNEFHPLK